MCVSMCDNAYVFMCKHICVCVCVSVCGVCLLVLASCVVSKHPTIELHSHPRSSV